MSFAALLNERVVIERVTPGAEDEWGNPALEWATLATVDGSVQPKSATEVALQSQGGAEITTHVIYLLPTDITGADRVRLEADAEGPYYQLTGKPRDAAGRGHHLECDAREIV